MSPWNDIPKRLATISIGVPLLWILWLNDFWRSMFWEGTHIIVAYEWTQMSEITPFAGFLLSSLVLVHCSDYEMILATLVAATAALTLSGQNTSAYLNGWMLITLPFRTWTVLSSKPDGFGSVVTLLLTVWNCDTGALLVGRITKGRLFGAWAKPMRKRLASISPNKSVEGLVGGVLFGTATYMAMPWLWKGLKLVGVPVGVDYTELTRGIHAVDFVVGFALSLAAIFGDLWESVLKRSYKVKDTGKLLPGHGGVLDRFDSSLLAVVLYHLYHERFLL